ncbi:MAG: hypothetical protein AB7O57_02945 [Hyphomicrobiaceae bacterium]
MITIQSGMLMALGFLAASLMVLLLAPAFWSRAVRLTTRRIKQTMPLSETEIEADRDRIRAEYAIKMHKLETLVEQVKLAGARQQIEINRRDARINTLEADLEKLQASYEEAQNARRVLEQTIADRLPKMEGRLTEARKVLHAREREIGELTRTAERQVRALAEASAINAQQQSEVERLTTSLAQRARGAGGRSDGSEALKAEIEALRAKTREQAQLIASLQASAGASDDKAAAAAKEQIAELQREARSLRTRNDEQASEVARLKAAMAALDGASRDSRRNSGDEQRNAQIARVDSLEAQSTQQSETIIALRDELAAANERLARQAAHFTDELKRLGATTASQGRQGRASASSRISLAERVALARGGTTNGAAGAPTGSDENNGAAGAGDGSSGVNGHDHTPDNAARLSDPATSAARGTGGPASPADGSSREPTSSAPAEASEAAAGGRPAASPRPRLLDRISGLSRTP